MAVSNRGKLLWAWAIDKVRQNSDAPDQVSKSCGLENDGDSATCSKFQKLTENTTRGRLRKPEEKASRNRQKYALLSPCTDTCRKQCYQNISEEHRRLINHTFWGKSFPERRGWLDSHIEVYDIKRRTSTLSKEDPRRKRSHSYTLPLADGRVQSVCKVMFMRALGLHTDGIITEFVRAKVKDPERAVSPTYKARGRHPPWNKLDKEVIKEHINSYNPAVSHYKHSNAPFRRYLEPHLTITAMWRDFCSKHVSISWEAYRKVFAAENITFGEPSQDECDSCLVFQLHARETKGDEAHNSASCTTCKESESHKVAYTNARMEYQKEIPSHVHAYTVDMQKILLLPKLSPKESFFVSRIVVFNETFARVGAKDQSDFLMLWHEGVAGRLAQDVASTYIKCVVTDVSSSILFWADNCGGKNKNWTLYTALAHCVNATWGPQEVVIKYLVKGHTYTKSDAVHGLIAQKTKKCENIYTYEDFVDICSQSSRNIKAIALQVQDFYDFLPKQRTRAGKKVQMPLLSSMCEVKFVKGKRTMQHKCNFDEEYLEVDFLITKFNVLSEFPAKKTEPRGICKAK